MGKINEKVPTVDYFRCNCHGTDGTMFLGTNWRNEQGWRGILGS